MKLNQIFYFLFCFKIYCICDNIHQKYLKVKQHKPLENVYHKSYLDKLNTKNKFICMKKCNELVDCEVIILKNGICFLFPRIEFSTFQSPSEKMVIFAKKNDNEILEELDIENLKNISETKCDFYNFSKKYLEECSNECFNECNPELRCLSGFCGCNQTSFFNETSSSCETKHEINEYCEKSAHCNEINFLECSINKRCMCLTNYIKIDGKCEKMYEYGESCSKTENCNKHIGLECIDSICNCTQNYLYQDRKCVMKIPAELSECNNEGECQDDTNLVCKNSKCICPEEKIWIENKCEDAINVILKTKSMIGSLVNFQLFFELNKVYKSPICSEMRITEASDSLTYKLPVSLGSVTIKVTVDNKDIGQDKIFNTDDYEDFCFILYRKISGDNSRPEPPILGGTGNLIIPNIINEVEFNSCESIKDGNFPFF